MGIEKAFDSLDHNFLIFALEKYGFGKNFMSWVRVKIFLKNQESSVLNGSTTTKYFLLEESLVKVIQFQLIYFSLRDLTSSHTIKTCD